MRVIEDTGRIRAAESAFREERASGFLVHPRLAERLATEAAVAREIRRGLLIEGPADRRRASEGTRDETMNAGRRRWRRRVARPHRCWRRQPRCDTPTAVAAVDV